VNLPPLCCDGQAFQVSAEFTGYSWRACAWCPSLDLTLVEESHQLAHAISLLAARARELAQQSRRDALSDPPESVPVAA
jgi:hypothetical protein